MKIFRKNNHFNSSKHIGYSVYVGNTVVTRSVGRDKYRDLTASVSNSVSVGGTPAVPISEYDQKNRLISYSGNPLNIYNYYDHQSHLTRKISLLLRMSKAYNIVQ